jgi:hypothetical protein
MRRVLRICMSAAVILAIVSSAEGSDGRPAKSLRKALLLSLVVPGAGQTYLGHNGRAKAMLAAEAGVWSSLAFFRVQGGMREDRYKEMAELFADVQGDRDDNYYQAIAYFMSSEDYNISVMREARYRYPYGSGDEISEVREKQLEYFEANGYFGEDAWEWESVEKKDQYAYTRTLSRRSYRRAVLTTGFAVLNRMVSMIDVYLSFKLGRVAKEGSYPHLRVEKGPGTDYRLFISTSF